MKLLTAVLIFAFFVPVLCEMHEAWSAPVPACSQHQSQREPEKDSLACCLLATLDRPVITELRHSEGDTGNISATLAPVFHFSISPTGQRVSIYQRIDHSGPPQLWVLNTSFRI